MFEQKNKEIKLPVDYKPKIERELEECTFQPTLVAKYAFFLSGFNFVIRQKPFKGYEILPRGYEQNIERIRQANAEKTKAKQQKEK